jgi:hypothetical protein
MAGSVGPVQCTTYSCGQLYSATAKISHGEQGDLMTDPCGLLIGAAAASAAAGGPDPQRC